MKSNWILKGFGICIAVIAGIFILGYVTMRLWNWLIPDIFTGANTIDYYHALGILVLSKLLFGGWGSRGRGGCHGHRGYWRHRFKGNWENMSEEEREKFRQRCGDWCEPGQKAETQKES